MKLMVVDTTGIQPYIFGSNRLRENIGGSHLVAQATGAWAFEAIRGLRSNVGEDGRLDDARRIEDGEIEVEVLYSGGGNFVAIFQGETEEGPRQFAGRLSRRVLTEAPGLRLVMASRDFEWGESLVEAMREAFRDLEVKKRSRPLRSPLAGLGVTMPCRSTGLPATRFTERMGDDAGDPISAEIGGKLDAVDAAGERLKEMLPLEGPYSYPLEFDNLGRTRGDFSYIAVVHADGNGIGERMISLGDRFLSPGANREFPNREFIVGMRRFSKAVGEASLGALREVLGGVIGRISDGKIVHARQDRMSFELERSKEGEIRLPFRPLVFGGDDVTFVCDGRLGISLAIRYLKRFEELTADLPDGKGAATACAGIAIVKSHYPFSRAYQLAEELCKSAKSYRREESTADACFDWHFATGGLFGSIESIRQREYETDAGSLCQRPLTLKRNIDNELRSWEVVRKGVEAFQAWNEPDDRKAEWAGRRNKIKALRDALRDGPEAVETFRKKYNRGNNLPNVCPTLRNIAEEGWQGERCGYFDAIEMIDWFYEV